MSSHDRAVHDVLGRMSDDEDNGADDDWSDDDEIAFVPKSQRLKRLQHSRPAAPSPSSPSPPLASGDAPTATANTTTAVRTETVYEQERNAKVRALLAEQQNSLHQRGVYTVDLFDGPLDMAQPSAAVDASSSSSYRGRGRGRSYDFATPRGGAGGNPNSHTPYQQSQGDGQRRFRMPNPNMTEEEQARFIRSRRNMAVTRNALREVDPETREYVQVTQAPDQVTSPYGGGDGGGGRGRGGVPYAGRGTGYRGRGVGGRGQGYGGPFNAFRGGGGGGGAPFRPYS